MGASSPVTPRPTRGYRFLLGGLATAAFRGLLRWRLDVRGLEHVPRQGGFVLAWNHHSNVDMVMVALPLCRRLDRQVRFLGKQAVWASPVTRWVAELADAIPVARDDDDSRAEAYDAAVAALRTGHVVGVAPEGTISDSFELLPFRLGAVRMAREAAAPVLPCVSWGSQRAFPRGRRPRPRFGQPVQVVFGEPVEVGRGEAVEAASDRLRDRMGQMLDAVQTSHPVEPDDGDDWWQPARLGGSAPPHDEVVAAHRRRERAWDGAEAERRDHAETDHAQMDHADGCTAPNGAATDHDDTGRAR